MACLVFVLLVPLKVDEQSVSYVKILYNFYLPINNTGSTVFQFIPLTCKQTININLQKCFKFYNYIYRLSILATLRSIS